MIEKKIKIDFSSKEFAHRLKTGIGKKQLIARAVGIKAGIELSVIDATAGLGKDAVILSKLGCQMTLIERSPEIYVLLKDALEKINIKIKLINADAILYLKKIRKKPDVIYLDPMYPERKKSALGKKELRILKEIVGADQDASELLAIALKKAKKRVVVKRPKLAPAISDRKPDLIYKGKSTRFDVYTHTLRN